MSPVTVFAETVPRRGTYTTRSLGGASWLDPWPSTRSFTAAPEPSSMRRAAWPSPPRTTTESLSQPTKRMDPAGFHALTATVGSTALAARRRAPAGACAGSLPASPSAATAAISVSARIARALEELDLLSVRRGQQRSQRGIRGIPRDGGLELGDGLVDDGEIAIDRRPDLGPEHRAAKFELVEQRLRLRLVGVRRIGHG